MVDDSITEEIRATRRRLAAQFDNDVSRIFADLRDREASDGRVYVSFPPRSPRKDLVDQRAMVAPPDSPVSGGEVPSPG